MEVEQINIEDEYKALKNEDNNSDHTIRKVNSEKKITNGILKKERTRKASNFCKKDKQTQNNININNNNSVKWDNSSINEQKDYRKNHPLDKEKLKESQSKYASVLDNGDVYMKGLNKVNEINPNDEVICKILNSLKVNSHKNKCMKRHKSSLIIGKYRKVFNLNEFYRITENEKIFDESLGEEQKLTLKNTLFNKINQTIPGKEVNIS